ncbi:MAG: hypothetical protein HKM23_08585 [Nitrosopumilus sp.]|nr:hypothetical protein [Nitrosopumilus sp.]NNL58535.1 hypothetical protein [Nitrosopumilus sp.]
MNSVKKILPEQRPHRNFRKKETSLTTEQKIEKFILRNSKNGFFTKVSTIPYKFEISESKSWDIVGELLSDGLLESIHDKRTGEMKLCEFGKIYEIMNLERKRKKDRFKNNKKESTK